MKKKNYTNIRLKDFILQNLIDFIVIKTIPSVTLKKLTLILS